MKNFLIFSIFLISGPVDCAGVTGYTGGRVLIYCRYDHWTYLNRTKYFCKINQDKCSDKILSKAQITSDLERRVFFVDETVPGLFGVLIKNVSRQDGGTYRCGVEVTTAKPTDVTLQVKEDPCCGKTLTQETHPGEVITFTCEYPQESKYLSKYLYKATDHSYRVVIFALGLSAQSGRFSLFDHPEENLFNVSISAVTEEDGGVYLCGVQGQKEGDQDPYYSLFNEIQLQVTVLALGTSAGSSVIITVCVCVVLLLIGGLLLIYKLRRSRTEGSLNRHISTNNPDSADYENDQPGNQNIQSPVYQNQNPNTNQSDSAYQSLNPNTIQSDSVYQSLNPNTKQSNSVYQSLIPTPTNDSAYQSLNPNTNQSDSAYQSLNPTPTSQIQPTRV